jgi:hypothetical protein
VGDRGLHQLADRAHGLDEEAVAWIDGGVQPEVHSKFVGWVHD